MKVDAGGNNPVKKKKKGTLSPTSVPFYNAPTPDYGAARNDIGPSSAPKPRKRPAPKTVPPPVLKEVRVDRRAWRKIFKPTKVERTQLEIAQEMRGQVSDFAFADFVGSIVDSRYPRIEQDTYSYLNKEANETAQDLSNYSDALFEGDDEYIQENPLDLTTPKLPIPKGHGIRGLLRQTRNAIRGDLPTDQKSALVQGYGEQIEHLQNVKSNIRFNKSYIRGQVQKYLTELNDNANYRDEEDISYGLNPELVKYIKKNKNKLALPEGKEQGEDSLFSNIVDGFLKEQGVDPDTVPENDKTPPKKLKPSNGDNKPFVENLFDEVNRRERVEREQILNKPVPAAKSMNPDEGEIFGGNALGAIDKVTPGDLVNSEVGEGLRFILDEGVGDGLYYTIDKLSRPLYGTVHGLDTWNAGDETTGTDNQERGLGAFLNSATLGLTGALEGVTGTNPGNSLDDFMKDPGLAARAVGDAWRGFSAGGWGSDSPDPMTMGNLIANNAARDPGLPGHYSNPQYQIWGGLAGDVIFDPLNLAGVGLVTTPVRTVKGAAETKRLMGLSKDLSRQINTAERIGPQPIPKPTTSQELFELMGGSKSWHRSAADKSKGTVEVEQNLRSIQNRLDRAIESIPENPQVQRLELLRKALGTRRQAVLDEYGADVLRTSIVRDLKLDESRDGKPFKQAIQEIDDLITIQRVKAHIPEAIKESNFLDEIAKEVGVKRLNKAGEETQYGSWTELQRQIRDLKSNGDEGRLATLLKQTEQAELRVRGSYPEGTPVGGRDLFESLGPEFRTSLGLSDEAKQGVFPEVMGLVRTREPYASELRKVEQTIEATTSAVRRAENKLASMKKKGGDTTQAERGLSRNKAALAHAEDRLNTLYADAYINRIKAKQVTKETGQKFYRDDDKAATLQQARDRANEELAQIASGEKVNTSNTGILGTMPDKLTGEMPRIQFNDLDEVFTPDASFDRTAQLTSIRDEAIRQLKGLETPFAGKPIDINLADVPEEFLTDGLFDIEKVLQEAVMWDSFTETFDVVPGLSGKTQEWATNIAKVLQDHFNVEFRKQIGIVRSRKTQQVRDLAEKEFQGTLDAEQFVKLDEMFAPNGNVTSPAIILGDQRILLGKPNKAILEHATPADRSEYFAFNKVMSDLTELRHQGKGKFNINDLSPESTQALTRLIKYMDESGTMALPTHPTLRPRAARMLLERYGNFEIVVDKTKPTMFEVVRGNNDLASELSMQSIVERRLFKSQHETTLREAFDLKDRFRGRVVEGKGKDWPALYPQGLTKKEFLKEALQSKSSFQKVTSKGSPFKVDTLATALSNKARRQLKGTKTPLAMGSTRWVDENWKYLTSINYNDAIKILSDIYSGPKYYKDKALAAQAATRKTSAIAKITKRLRDEGKDSFTGRDFQAIKDQAFRNAKGQVEASINSGQLSQRTFDSSLTLRVPRNEYLNDADLIEMLRKQKGDKYAEEKAALLAERSGPSANLREVDARISKLTERHRESLARLEKYQAEAIEAKAVLHKRMNEDALLRTANMLIAKDQKQLSWAMMNQNIRIPGSQVLFKAADAVSGLPIIKQTRQAWSNAFSPPSSKIPAEAQLAFWRKNGMTPNIIEHHVLEMKRTLGQFSKNDRKAAFEAYLNGNKSAYRGSPEIYNAIEDAFNPILHYFQGKEMVGGVNVRWGEIEKYLPEAFKLDTRLSERGFDNVSDILHAMKKRALKETEGNAKARTKRLNQLADPYETLWNMRIATENALAWRAFDYTVSETFGIKRLAQVDNTGSVKSVTPAGKAIEQLQKMGWKPSEQFGGNKYLFPPEIHKDLDTLAKMTKPGKEQELLSNTIDAGTRYWKTMATIYNPGYWTRNGVGEIMSSWFAGVNSPEWYKHSASVIRYARNDGQELDALTKQLPMLNYLPKESIKGDKILYTLPDGTKVTPELIWLGYNDQGLKTGFLNTEFDRQYSKAGALTRDNPVTRQVARGHQGLRTTGEWYEDYLRMAHFLAAVKKAPKNYSLNKRFEHAAAEVRKYHFDYTDFTDFEKAVMLRAFPFYKWTRKALPLMVTMLFQKPGKVMAYPKVMNALSNSLTTGDIAQDENGFAPNFEEFTPNWIQNLWGYKIRENDDEGGTNTFFNIATPQMDIYKGLQNPTGMAYALSNPLARVPAEQLAGKTFGHDLMTGGYNWNFGEFNEEDNDRTTHAMNAVPITNFLNKLNIPQGIPPLFGKGDEGDSFEDHDAKEQNLFSFLTGLGFYYDDENRRYGEEMRQKNG